MSINAAGQAAASRPQLALVLGFIVGLIWAAWVIVSARGFQQGFTPFDLTLFRFAVPAIVALPWFFRRGVYNDWRKLIFVGACIGVPHALLIQFGIQATSTTHAAVLLPGFIPIFTGLMAWGLLRERPTLIGVGGFALILAGVAFIALDGPNGGTGLDLVWPGDAFFIFGALLWSCFTLMLKIWAIRPLEAVALVAVVSTIVYVPIYVIWLPKSLDQATWLAYVEQGLFQGLTGILVAMALYAVVVRLAGAQPAATISASVPILTVALALLFLGIVPTWLELAGCAAAGAGIWMVVRWGTRPDPTNKKAK